MLETAEEEIPATPLTFDKLGLRERRSPISWLRAGEPHRPYRRRSSCSKKDASVRDARGDDADTCGSRFVGSSSALGEQTKLVQERQERARVGRVDRPYPDLVPINLLAHSTGDRQHRLE